MYICVRKFGHVRSLVLASQRAETGVGQLMKRCHFYGHYMFDAGDGAGASVALFDSRQASIAANEKARSLDASQPYRPYRRRP